VSHVSFVSDQHVWRRLSKGAVVVPNCVFHVHDFRPFLFAQALLVTMCLPAFLALFVGVPPPVASGVSLVSR
jgi:hypothetical protein